MTDLELLLQRRSGAVDIPWAVADDAVSPTGVADPVADYALRDKVDIALSALRDALIAALQATLAVDVTDEPARQLGVVSVAGAVTTRDDFQGGEVLADQVGAGDVLTFTFSAAVQLVVIDANGATTDVARADPFGGTPDAAVGIPCRDEVPTYLPVTTTTVKVWAPTGMTVSVCGYRRA